MWNHETVTQRQQCAQQKKKSLCNVYQCRGASAPVTGRAETAAAAAPTQPKAPAKTAAKAPVSTPAAAPQADLLGMSGPAAPVAPVASGVLLGVDAPAASVPPTSTPHPTPAASSASLDDFFSGGARAAPAKAEPDYAALFGAAPAMAGGEMIDFGLDAADVPPEFADLYAKDQVRLWAFDNNTVSVGFFLLASCYRHWLLRVPLLVIARAFVHDAL